MRTKSSLISNRSHGQRRQQRGVALVFVLIMMTISTSIALISARTTLQAERSSRNDRDRQVAFQAAELALNDAELDIMDPNTIRGCKFGTASIAAGEGCSANPDARGFCGVKPDLDAQNKQPSSTSIGKTTTTRLAPMSATVNSPTVPTRCKPARWCTVQEAQIHHRSVRSGGCCAFDNGRRQFETRNAYRVYALGYGASPDTQVLLEGVFIKPLLSNKCIVGGGL